MPHSIGIDDIICNRKMCVKTYLDSIKLMVKNLEENIKELEEIELIRDQENFEVIEKEK